MATRSLIVWSGYSLMLNFFCCFFLVQQFCYILPRFLSIAVDICRARFVLDNTFNPPILILARKKTHHIPHLKTLQWQLCCPLPTSPHRFTCAQAANPTQIEMRTTILRLNPSRRTPQMSVRIEIARKTCRSFSTLAAATEPAKRKSKTV